MKWRRGPRCGAGCRCCPCLDGAEESTGKTAMRAAAKSKRRYAGRRIRPRWSLRRVRTRGGQPRTAPLASIVADARRVLIRSRRSRHGASGCRRGGLRLSAARPHLPQMQMRPQVAVRTRPPVFRGFCGNPHGRKLPSRKCKQIAAASSTCRLPRQVYLTAYANVVFIYVPITA